MMGLFGRLGVLSAALLLVRCGGDSLGAFDSGPDPADDAAAEAAPLGHPPPDAAAGDALDDPAPVEAGGDALDPLDAGAAPDAADAGDGSDGAPLGGNTCPILGGLHCVNGTEFRVTVPDPDGAASVDELCGSAVPSCPSGWVCWQLNSQSQRVQSVCP